MTRLASGLPKGPENGLDAIARSLIADPTARRVVIAVVDCSRLTTNTDTDETVATVRVLRVEQVHPGDVAEAHRLVRRALEHRHGDSVLPLETERDLEAWFGQGFTLDPSTGELVDVDEAPDAGPDED